MERMAGSVPSLEITGLQREALRRFKGLNPAQILCGTLASHTHESILGHQFVAFLRVMQQEVPDVFGVFGDDPEAHVRALVPKVLAPLQGGRYTVLTEGLAEVKARLQSECARDLQSLWLIGALFVQYRGSVRPPPPHLHAVPVPPAK
jgi:hypothetical protein